MQLLLLPYEVRFTNGAGTNWVDLLAAPGANTEWHVGALSGSKSSEVGGHIVEFAFEGEESTPFGRTNLLSPAIGQRSGLERTFTPNALKVPPNKKLRMRLVDAAASEVYVTAYAVKSPV